MSEAATTASTTIVRPRVTIYCDGSCSPNPGFGGWAAMLISRGGNVREICGAELESTNNRMELTGAIMALRALNRPCQVDLHSDSRYVLNPFLKGWLKQWIANSWRKADRTPVLNVDLWQELQTLSTVHNVGWHWVRGHGDCAENNRCDELAVAARLRLRDGRA